MRVMLVEFGETTRQTDKKGKEYSNELVPRDKLNGEVVSVVVRSYEDATRKSRVFWACPRGCSRNINLCGTCFTVSPATNM